MLRHNNELFHNINNTYGATSSTSQSMINNIKHLIPEHNDSFTKFNRLLQQRKEMKQRLDLSKVILDNEARMFTSKTARLGLIISVHKALYNTVDLSVGKCKYYTNSKELDVLPTDYDGDALILNSMIKCRDEYLYTTANVSTKRKYYFGHSDQLQPYSRSV